MIFTVALDVRLNKNDIHFFFPLTEVQLSPDVGSYSIHQPCLLKL